MGRDISLFSDYHSRENSLTNYCGLLMKMLYEDSPRRFEELLASLVKTDINIIVGPTFTQQTKMKKSIPDLSITQKSFSIFFETKTTDWFYEDQVKRHIDGFNHNDDNKILFLLSNFDDTNQCDRFLKNESNIIIQQLSFEDLIGALEQVCNTEYLKNILEEFKIYLDRNDLLPKWKYLLDVVNCVGTNNEIAQNVYMCPDTGGAYSHRRAKYFGAYSNKKVGDIFEIKSIIVFQKNLEDAKVKWNNTTEKDEILIAEAEHKLKSWQWRIDENRTVPIQVFLLGDKAETNFIKDSSGGMYGSKKYFIDIALDCMNSQELANKLKNRNWSDFDK